MSHLVHRSDFLLSQNSADQRCSSGASGARSGFTLIEVMIAVTVTLLMMLGLAQMFKVLGDSMNKGRAGLELNNRLRGVMHRIRTDLDLVTAPARPPLATGMGKGYLKYYEGPASDYTFANNPILNRFGDMDDILMATVKAEDTWFTGKVPRFIAEQRAPTSAAELDDLVTIASQYAEIIVYAQPLVSAQGNPVRDPLLMVSNPLLFEDVNPADGVPDSFRLHYRALLIRPDLNLPTSGLLPSLPAENVMVARPQTGPTGGLLPSPQCDMSRIFQYCDLSIRRVDHFGVSAVAANSLEDLANPANRFAHVMHPLNAPANSVWSMPVLALGPALAGFQGSNPSVAGSGFLHPAYVLHGNRTGEDVLATDLLAFDVRAYDPSAPIIEYYDPSPPIIEYSGLTLRPGDPGFEFVGLPDLAINSTETTVRAYGEFVDLNWAGKFENLSILPIQLRGLLVSQLSGLQFNPFTDQLEVSKSLFRSGLVIPLNSVSYQIFQPSYDTFTDFYEHDGILQAELAAYPGLVTFTAAPTASVLREGWRAIAVDAGTDGIDNNPNFGPGIDDASELESSPPFPVHLRGLQISIRLENRPSKQFKQMSAVKEFVTN
jgi:prepilin-type N-terminal cleavage/methylation domain-containing protein